VGRERSDDADEFLLRGARPDAETLGGEDAVGPAADRSQAKKAIRCDRLNQETDLIHVRREDHAGPFLFLGRRGEHAAQAVGLQRAAAEFADENRSNSVLVAGRAVGLRVGLQQTEGFGRTLGHGENQRGWRVCRRGFKPALATASSAWTAAPVSERSSATITTSVPGDFNAWSTRALASAAEAISLPSR